MSDQLYEYEPGHDDGCVCFTCIAGILREVDGDYGIDPEPFLERLAGMEAALDRCRCPS